MLKCGFREMQFTIFNVEDSFWIKNVRTMDTTIWNKSLFSDSAETLIPLEVYQRYNTLCIEEYCSQYIYMCLSKLRKFLQNSENLTFYLSSGAKRYDAVFEMPRRRMTPSGTFAFLRNIISCLQHKKTLRCSLWKRNLLWTLSTIILYFS